ncbi:MAG TPA: ATP synthase subunit C [Nitrososphaerales archaeon]|jgi:V/A-type H+-transporting ATPase subunit K|nr:ATP synthase subunit C [Nitrososphaerales archaeon]|tara:strand:+ start:308 stop:607 length:300 start_codon:yes stop_codon:yes gene_type:complete
MNYKTILIVGLVLSIFSITPAFAQEETLDIAGASKFLSAALAFSAAAIGAGLAVGKAGSAGLAASAEKPELKTTAIIITALGEAIAIYGIVVAILILGN